VGLTAPEWDLIAATQGAAPKPKRDVVITDGEKLTLGDTTVTMYLTPGHTAGALSYLIPVKDHGRRHVVALSGIASAAGAENLKMHMASAARFAEIVGKANADVMISDEDHFASYIRKIDALTASHSGPDAFIVGNEAVKRYLTVVGECSAAVLASLQ
jgi:metallo-beta-lactamase class B